MWAKGDASQCGSNGAMRIFGRGVDVADIGRVGCVLERYPRFAERCFMDHVREYAFSCAISECRFAARFTGKKAVM